MRRPENIKRKETFSKRYSNKSPERNDYKNTLHGNYNKKEYSRKRLFENDKYKNRRRSYSISSISSRKSTRRNSISSEREKSRRKLSSSISSRSSTSLRERRRETRKNLNTRNKPERESTSLSSSRKRVKRRHSSYSSYSSSSYNSNNIKTKKYKRNTSNSYDSYSSSLMDDSRSYNKSYSKNYKSGKYENYSKRKDINLKYFGDCGVVLLFLPIKTMENEIRELFQNYHNKTKEIKLVPNKDGITVHGFVELSSLSVCRQFISQKVSGVIDFANCRIKVITENEYYNESLNGFNLYSSPELPNHLKSDSFAKSLLENLPCNVLILKSLKYSATEEQVRESVSTLTTDPIYDVRVIKDKSSGQSRGFCFVEMGTVADAAKLLNTILRKVPYYTICNRKILAGFARMNLYNENGFSSLLPATVDFFTQEKVSNVVNNAIAAATSLQNSNPIALESHVTYDQQSNYYFDKNTGYYYDSNTGYYFDPNNQIYLQYDVNTSQWLTIDLNENYQKNEILQNNTNFNQEPVSNTIDKSQNPNDIVKSMEKWAKKQNVNKKKQFINFKKLQNMNEIYKTDNINDDSFVLSDRLICLLCIRKFKSKFNLDKHVKFSQLHKDNLILFNARTVASIEAPLIDQTPQ